MMRYLDTSALLKAYVAEVGSALVVAAIAAATRVATGGIAYAEARAAFARALREHRLTQTEHATQVARLDTHWSRYFVVDTDPHCIREAGRLADKHTGHALRAFDALHLASALDFAGGDPASASFACWDLRLWRAARDEGFLLVPSTEPMPGTH